VKNSNQHQDPGFKIRSYEESDEQAVANLWQEVFPDAPAWNDPVTDIRRKLTVQPDLFFVALKDRQLVGTAMAGYDGHRGWIYYVVVSPNHRRQGIGNALMGHAEGALMKMGCPKLNLQVRATNHEVVAFYKQLGYEIEERISMAKRLDLSVSSNQDRQLTNPELDE
jgi:ribosomal protein S18 acetylase RimI-like enzyme